MRVFRAVLMRAAPVFEGEASAGSRDLLRDPFVWVATIVGCCATFFALFAGRYLPYIDWSNHIGLISVLAHGGDTGALNYFERSWMPSPYLLFYAASALLAQFFAVETASKLVLVLASGAIVLAAGSLCQATGRSPRLGAIAPLSMFGLSMGWGFASFVVATPFLLWAFAGCERVLFRVESERSIARALRSREGFWCAVSLALLFLAHGFIFFVGAICIATRTFAFAARRPQLLVTSVFAMFFAAVPAVVLALPATIQLLIDPTIDAGTDTTHKLEWHPLEKHLETWRGDLLDRGSADQWQVMDWALVLWLVWLAVSIFRPSKGKGFGLEIHALLLTVLWLFGPMTVVWPSTIWMLYPRFAIIAVLMIALLPRVSLARFGVLLAVPALFLVAWNATINAQHIKNFGAYADRYDGVRKLIPKGARVLPLTVPRPGDPPLAHHSIGSLYHYLLADGAAYVPFLFDKKELPVHYKEKGLPRAPFWRTPWAYDPKTHGMDHDYLVLWGSDLIHRTEQAGLHQEIGVVGPWVVFKTTATSTSTNKASVLRPRSR